MRSNIAVLKTRYQDKLIRNFLSTKGLGKQAKDFLSFIHIVFISEPLERWLGGVYDGENQSWKWAASGKALQFDGFGRTKKLDKDLRWQCIIMDPSLGYK